MRAAFAENYLCQWVDYMLHSMRLVLRGGEHALQATKFKLRCMPDCILLYAPVLILAPVLKVLEQRVHLVVRVALQVAVD